MKRTGSSLWRAAGVVSVVCGLLFGSLAVEAEGLNAKYARMANEVVPKVSKALGRDFTGQLYIEGVAPAKMASVLADDMRLAVAEKALATNSEAMGQALSRIVPMHYSFSARRIYYAPETLNILFERSRLSNAGRDAATRLLLAYQLARVLCDQQFNMRRLLAGAGSEDRSKCIRALLAGEARITVELVARDLPRVVSPSEISAWTLGRGASENQTAAIANRLEEEFDVCYAGGYSLASRLYEESGVETLHKAYFSPPSSVSILYNPGNYPSTLQSAKPVPDPNLAAGPVNAPVEGAAGEPRLRTALLEAKRHLPVSDWFEKSFPFDAMIQEAEKTNPQAAQELKEVFAEWEGLGLVNLELPAGIRIYGFKLRQEVTEDQVQGLLIDLEKAVVDYGKGDLVYTPGDNLPLAGVGFGSGWVQPGTLSKPGDQAVPTRLVVARTGNYAIYMFMTNLAPSPSVLTAMVNDIFKKLQ